MLVMNIKRSSKEDVKKIVDEELVKKLAFILEQLKTESSNTSTLKNTVSK